MKRGGANFAVQEYITGTAVDPYHVLIGSIPFMVDHARKAATEEAYSYRSFHVGAAIFAYSPEFKRTGIFSAGNTKHENKKKRCAEMKVLKQVKRSHDFSQAIGLVVAGTSDKELIEGVTGIATPTLQPCRECRNILGKSPLVDGDTLIITTGKDSDAHQVHSFAELQAFYDGAENGANINDAHYHEAPNFDDWHIRQALYDRMVSNNRIFEQTGNNNALVAKMAMSGVFLDPAPEV